MEIILRAPTSLTAAAIALAFVVTGGAARAQSGVEAFNGNWVASAITPESGEMVPIAPADFTVAINGDNDEFEAEWTVLTPDVGGAAWHEQSADFESAERPGYFGPDDEAEFFEGDPVLWAHIGANGLLLGQLRIDDDSGGHVVFTCRLVRTESGLDAVIVQSTDAGPAARSLVSMVRK